MNHQDYINDLLTNEPDPATTDLHDHWLRISVKLWGAMMALHIEGKTETVEKYRNAANLAWQRAINTTRAI